MPDHADPIANWTRARSVSAVLCGVITGILVPNSLQVGLGFYFPESMEWGSTFWGEHWVLRPLASVVSAFFAGALAGAIARRRGELVAALAVTPSVLAWAFLATSGWLGHAPFSDVPVYVSIGNRLAASVTVFVLIPVARAAGAEGERFGQVYATHFDSRPGTLLGVRWFHFVWLPVVIHFLLVQVAWAGYYGLEWLKVTLRSGANYYAAIVPMLFLGGLWASLILVGRGARSAYQVLSGIDEVSSGWGRLTLVVTVRTGWGSPYSLA